MPLTLDGATQPDWREFESRERKKGKGKEMEREREEVDLGLVQGRMRVGGTRWLRY